MLIGDFGKGKFIQGTSLIFTTVIQSYGTPFPKWGQKKNEIV